MNAARIARNPEAFSLSSGKKRPRQKAPDHLKFIRSLRCCVCESGHNVHAAHIRMGARRYGKPITGIGEKPSDCWAVPLCASHHLFGKGAQHTMGEWQFWVSAGINPFLVAMALWVCTGDQQAAGSILINVRQLGHL